MINELIPPLSNLIKKGVSRKELDAILNHFSSAVLIIDTKQNEILSCNLETIELTGYTRDQIRQTPFTAFFPLLPKDVNFNTLSNLSTQLKSKNSFQEIFLEFHQISNIRPILLVKMETQEELHQKEIANSRANQQWEALHALALAPHQKDQNGSIRQALQAGQILTGSSFLAVYLPKNEKYLQAEFSRGNIDFLPKIIKQSEISHLRLPYIWELGTRSTSILHQKALAENLTYIATCPLDNTHPANGTLVIGDQIGHPPENLLDLLQVTSGTLLSCITYHQKIETINSKAKDVSSLRKITDIIKNVIAGRSNFY